MRLAGWLPFKPGCVFFSAFLGINLKESITDAPASSSVSAKVSHFGAALIDWESCLLLCYSHEVHRVQAVMSFRLPCSALLGSPVGVSSSLQRGLQGSRHRVPRDYAHTRCFLAVLDLASCASRGLL